MAYRDETYSAVELPQAARIVGVSGLLVLLLVVVR